jgi:hypothetical protein
MTIKRHTQLIIIMRQGREIYSDKYEKALSLYKQGKNVNDIAKELNVSYSAAYHWVKGLRKPEAGNVNDFIAFLRSNGPSSLEIQEHFPKHNELFLTASRRGLPLKRIVLGRKYKEYSTWYLLDGQEAVAKQRIEQIFSKIKEFKDELREILMNFDKVR